MGGRKQGAKKKTTRTQTPGRRRKTTPRCASSRPGDLILTYVPRYLILEQAR